METHPAFPRQKESPSKLDDFFGYGKTPAEHPNTPADYYRPKYFEALDIVIACIQDLFNREDYEMYATCEQLLLKAAHNQPY